MDSRYFDAHSHIQDKAFDADRDVVISRMKEEGIGALVVGTDMQMSRDAVGLAEAHENLWAVIGLHPTDNRSEQFDFDAYKTLGEHPKVVAVGECGLDYFHATDPAEREQQKALFREQIRLAEALGKPLMVHIRPSKGSYEDAYRDALEILGEYPKVTGNIHFFAGTPELAREFSDRGFTMSFTGVVTFARDYDEILRTLPLSHILSETDCPYVAPLPYRGKRNEPAYVSEVAKKIAEIRGEPFEMVQKALVENGLRVFNISGMI